MLMKERERERERERFVVNPFIFTVFPTFADIAGTQRGRELDNEEQVCWNRGDRAHAAAICIPRKG